MPKSYNLDRHGTYYPGMLQCLKAAADNTARTQWRSMCDIGWDIDDLIQNAWLRVGRFVKSEENMRKYMYLNAKRCMYNMIQAERRRLSRIPYTSYDNEDFELDELAVCYNPSILKDMLPLTSREKQIIYLYYFSGWILKDIGNALGLTRERIRQIKLKALKKLKEYYE